MGFFYLRQSYSIVQDIVKYGFMPQITHFFSENELYTIGCFENMTAHQSRQVMSGKHLFESIDTANTAFFDYFKPLYVPSKHNTFQKYYKQDTEWVSFLNSVRLCDCTFEELLYSALL